MQLTEKNALAARVASNQQSKIDMIHLADKEKEFLK